MSFNKLIIFITVFVARTLAADPVCAKGPLTLRKTPNLSGAVTWKVSTYMPFVRLEKKGSWSKLKDLEGEVHWAPTRDVTNQIQCVVVRADVVALHNAPSASAPANDLRTLDRYTPLKRLVAKSGWMQVEDEAKHLAWVREDKVWKPVQVASFTF